MKPKFLFFLSVLLVWACNTESIENREFSDNSRAKYEFLLKEYNLQDYVATKTDGQEQFEFLQPIETVEQLEAILEEVKKSFVIEQYFAEDNMSIDDIAIPTLQSISEGPDVVLVKKVTNNGRTDVYINVQQPSVVTSAFYPSGGLLPLFAGYEHVSGSVSVAGAQINFAAYGEMIFKIALDGIELKRTPVVTYGYYNKSTGIGELTN